MLVVIDEFTRESLAIEVAWSFTACRVVEVLQYLFAVRGAPEHIRSDNGPEFVAQEVTRGLYLFSGAAYNRGRPQTCHLGRIRS